MIIGFISPSQAASRGRRESSRRPFGLVIALITVLSLTLAAAPADQSRIEVREHDGTYEVVATFATAQPPAIAMKVLTDYERIPRFMPDVRRSQVLERRDNRVVVEQEAVSKFLLFSKQVHLILDIEEGTMSLTFQDRCKKAFSKYDGRWVLEQQSDRTDVTYTLTAKPAFDVPGFLVKKLMKRDAEKMIGRLQAEIAARAKQDTP
jgi:ribosome-associated toxin RatA of RatAB toxin-antitoxin module